MILSIEKDILLYEFHPIFEFYLTSFFAIILAPSFIGEFVSFKIYQRYSKEKENLKEDLDRTANTINEWLNKNEALSPFNKIKDSINLIKEQCKQITTIDNTNLTEEETETIEKLKRKAAKFITNTFNTIFFCSGFFAFILLLISGYETNVEDFWHMHSFVACYNFCTFLILIFLIGKFKILEFILFSKKWFPIPGNKDDYFLNTPSFEWNSIFIAILSFGSLLLAFILYLLLKRLSINVQFENIITCKVLVVSTCISLGAIPLTLFVFCTDILCKRFYFRFLYSTEIGLVKAQYDITSHDYNVFMNELDELRKLSEINRRNDKRKKILKN
jgi:hypothetical protein